MIFWRKIVIFHTKYPNNVRASLRSAQFLNAGQSLAYLQSSGILPVLSDKLNNVVKIGAICVVHSLRILPCILSAGNWVYR
jgi:hypothetical protein